MHWAASGYATTLWADFWTIFFLLSVSARLKKKNMLGINHFIFMSDYDIIQLYTGRVRSKRNGEGNTSAAKCRKSTTTDTVTLVSGIDVRLRGSVIRPSQINSLFNGTQVE